MPIDVEADLVERSTVEMPKEIIVDLEAETSERAAAKLPMIVTADVEVA